MARRPRILYRAVRRISGFRDLYLVKYELGIGMTKNRASLFVDGEHRLKETLRAPS